MKIRIALLSCLLGMAAFAADVSGKWTAEVQGRNGTMTQTYTFKVDGSTLTGTVDAGRGGPAEIKNGKIDGDTITFEVVREFNGNTFTSKYTGTVSGDEIKFSIDMGRGQPREVTAKRASGT